MLQIAQDSGRLTVSYNRFEVDDSKGKPYCQGLCELARNDRMEEAAKQKGK